MEENTDSDVKELEETLSKESEIAETTSETEQVSEPEPEKEHEESKQEVMFEWEDSYIEEKTRSLDWKAIIIISIIYSLSALLLNVPQMSAILQHEERLTIVFTALGSIIFGPVIGGLGAGFGNVLYDLISHFIIDPRPLSIKNFLGFLGNLAGGAIIGWYARKLTVHPDDKIFTLDNIKKWIHNTFATIFGLSVVLPIIIGGGGYFLTLIGIPVYTAEKAIEKIGEIAISNGIVAVLLMVPVQITFVALERKRLRAYREILKSTTKLKRISKPKTEIIKIKWIHGGKNGFVLGKWGSIDMLVQNILDRPMKYRVEVHAQDRIDPSVFYTKLLQPGDVDHLYVEIFPFDDAKRELKITFRPWVETYDELVRMEEANLESVYRYKYNVVMPANRRMRAMVTIVGLLALIVTLARGLASVASAGSDLSALELTGGIVLIELLAIILYYIYRKKNLKKLEAD